jgi:hypothetical protein
VLYIDGTFLKKGIPIRPVYSECHTPYRILYRVRYCVRIFRYRIRCLLNVSDIVYHLLVMDGQEVGAALMCYVNQCPVCTCPHSELDWTDVTYPYSNMESVKAAVKEAPTQEEHLDEDGQVLDGHNVEVRNAVLIYH